LGQVAKGQSGQGALIVVLIMLVLGAVIIGPLLGFMVTGLKAGQTHEGITQGYYAADAGVEDALWQIKHDRLSILLTTYDQYDYYSAYPYPYSLVINDNSVNVTIQNVWVPRGIDAPTPSQANSTIQQGKLMITGGLSGTSASVYQIGMIYYYGAEGNATLKVEKVGIWLPPGFHYVSGSSSLETGGPSKPYYPSSVEIAPYKSGEAVVWNFSSLPMFKLFPGSNSTSCPMGRTVTFNFTGPAGQTPGSALSWIDTTGVSGIDYTWDADKKVYEITSTATDATGKETEVESYAVKTEMRQLGSSVSGDYIAIGNSLMMPDANNNPSDPNQDWRSRLLKESSATVPTGSIPAGATVEGAYLYWSGWIDHYYWYYENRAWHWSANPDNWGVPQDNLTGLVYDASNLTQMVEGWADGSGKGAKVNTVNFNGSDITTHQWQVWPKTNDSPACWYYTCFYDATDIVKPLIEEDGVSTFTFGHASQGATSVINQTPPRPNFPRIPSAPSSDHTRGYSFTLYDSNGNPSSDYTGYPLGTPATRLPGATGTYHGRYHASYAGWSLVVIYSSPETQGHQLYLYDIKNPNFTFKESYPEGASESNPDFDGDGNPGGKISGFLVPQPIAGEVNAAKITCFVGEGDKGKTGDSFKVTGPSGSWAYLLDGTPGAVWNDVWNSKSAGVTASGIDIDTFYVTWSSQILSRGDTWAQVDIPTVGDGFTLSYIILSFRSEVTTGGTISYLIR